MEGSSTNQKKPGNSETQKLTEITMLDNEVKM
jgi:hypothetical protein